MKTQFSELSTVEAISVLKEMGDGANAGALASLVEGHPNLGSVRLSDLPESEVLARASWRGTEHTYGYVKFGSDSGDFLDIQFASTIEPDNTLKGKMVNIKLGSLYTMSYPGWGRHNVLMHFKCKHAKEDSNETALVEFEQKFKSLEGEGAGNLGDFVFVGLRVPSNGLQFEVQTVNVSNDSDDEALKILESETIKNGLDLVNASFATLAPFTQMAQGVLGLLLTRNQNKIVQKFTIGFDFDPNAVDIAKLRLGTYVVAQVKRNEMPWSEWVYQRSTGLVVNKEDPSIRLPYNHITFNVLGHNVV
ncbi:MAG: hypothetical protein IPN95_26720 [Bacteroidetes bacterium]|nr:hypothetical protein [Bacteroidota bacterium]